MLRRVRNGKLVAARQFPNKCASNWADYLLLAISVLNILRLSNCKILRGAYCFIEPDTPTQGLLTVVRLILTDRLTMIQGLAFVRLGCT